MAEDDNEITDENYCDWRQSNCPWVKDLRARIAALEAALKPFADYAEQMSDDADRWSVAATHLRAARAALEGK